MDDYDHRVVGGERLVVGVDAGGTNVRVLVVDAAGRRLGAGTAAGANPVSHGLDVFSEQFEIALGIAVSTVDPSTVGLVALGLAGGSAHGTDALSAVLDGIWRRRGLSCPWELISDMEAAHAAGSPDPDGLVVLSGTGAAVAEIRGGSLVRYLDGAGWLLGDIGSGLWLGLEAVRAAIADRDGRGRPTALTAPVCAMLGISLEPPAEPRVPGADLGSREIVAAAYRRTPVSLSELAPAVSAAATGGDVVASALVARAAEALLGEADLLLRDSVDIASAVLAGGVLLADGPLRAAVREGLAGRRGLRVGEARDGAAGAAWCGLMRTAGPLSADVHERLLRTA